MCAIPRPERSELGRTRPRCLGRRGARTCVACLLLVLGAPLLLAGCGGGGGGETAPGIEAPAAPTVSDEAFVLDAYQRGRLALTVSLDGTPVSGARMTVEDPREPLPAEVAPESTSTGGCYFRGATNKSGSCAGDLRVPSRFEGVDVVVHLPGASGPYTHEPLRREWGPTAPSARLHVPFSDFPTDDQDALTLHVDLWSR